MSHLVQIQKGFQDYLLAPSAVPGMDQHIVGTVQTSAQLRLDIYADAYRLRLEEALGNDFEALHSLLGDEQFYKLCLKYIDAHPSQHFSLRYFGQHMSAFLRLNEPYSTQPMLAELAEFEWALIDAFDAQDSAVVSIEDMGMLAPEAWPEMRFDMHDSVRRLEFAWNVQSLWSALKEETTPEPPKKNEVPQSWLIWRSDLVPYFRALTAPEAWALDAACGGMKFSLLCEGLCVWVEEDQAAATAAGFLYRWVSDGLIKQVVPPGKN
ncbi:MAG: DNA-binding domain-containing protein [Gammaproteobacteria bacterium]